MPPQAPGPVGAMTTLTAALLCLDIRLTSSTPRVLQASPRGSCYRAGEPTFLQELRPGRRRSFMPCKCACTSDKEPGGG